MTEMEVHCRSRAVDQHSPAIRTFIRFSFFRHRFSRLPWLIFESRGQKLSRASLLRFEEETIHSFLQWRREGRCCFASTTSGQGHAPTSTPLFPANPLPANQMLDLGSRDNQVHDISRRHAPTGKKLLQARKATDSRSSTVQGRNCSKMPTRQ